MGDLEVLCNKCPSLPFASYARVVCAQSTFIGPLVPGDLKFLVTRLSLFRLGNAWIRKGPIKRAVLISTAMRIKKHARHAVLDISGIDRAGCSRARCCLHGSDAGRPCQCGQLLPMPSATEPRANLHATAAIACTGTVHLYIIYMWEQAAHNSSWHWKQQGQICLRNECSRTVPERRLRTIRGEMG